VEVLVELVELVELVLVELLSFKCQIRRNFVGNFAFKSVLKPRKY